MALHFISLGLHDAKDITLRGLERAKSCTHLYLDTFTSNLSVPRETLENDWHVTIQDAPRATLENHSADLIRLAKTSEVGVLVVGDAFAATTHLALLLEAKAAGVPTTITHNASILTAVGECGLDLYRFGRTITLVWPRQGFSPASPIAQMEKNRAAELHTLILLDSASGEDRPMTIPDAIAILETARHSDGTQVLPPSTFLVGCARLGGQGIIAYAPPGRLALAQWGDPPHCLIIPSTLSAMEKDALQLWTLARESRLT